MLKKFGGSLKFTGLFKASTVYVIQVINYCRSPPITELTFLNRLRIVEGKKNKTSILIFENQNLQTILDWRTRGNGKLKLKNGNIQIFSNMLLCGNETKRFQDIIERSGEYSDLIHNNGGKNKCTANSIATSFYVLSHDSCAIRWSDASLKDKHTFNAFIIQYVPIMSTKFLDENMLLERDSCSSYGWQHAFVKDLHYTYDGLLEYNLTELNQFTTYAFTVQTYQYGGNETSFQLIKNSTEYDGAISQVKTFRTLLKAPSRVKNLETMRKTFNRITLQWSVAENEDPAIEFFYLDVLKRPFNVTLIDRRNYCINPIEKTESETIERFRVNQYQELIDDDQLCCDNCCQLNEERQVVRKQQDSDFQANLKKFSELPRSNLEPRVEIKKRKNFIKRVKIPTEYRNYTIDGLSPFTLYSFHLHACSSDSKCSDYELHSEMTQMNGHESFDRVELQPSSYVFEGTTFHIHFDEPTDKNGAIISYHTELKEIIKNSSIHLSSDCVTRHQHQMNGFKCA